MKYFVVAGALACALCGNAYGVDDAKINDTAVKDVVIEEGAAKGEKEIDTTGGKLNEAVAGQGVNDRRVMPVSESYNENTGLQDVTASDRQGELE